MRGVGQLFPIFPHARSSLMRYAAFSVFDPAGTFLGEVTMPPRFIAKNITNDRVMGFWTDDDDAQHIRVYALYKPASDGS
jgi:hypothetical protein